MGCIESKEQRKGGDSSIKQDPNSQQSNPSDNASINSSNQNQSAPPKENQVDPKQDPNHSAPQHQNSDSVSSSTLSTQPSQKESSPVKSSQNPPKPESAKKDPEPQVKEASPQKSPVKNEEPPVHQSPEKPKEEHTNHTEIVTEKSQPSPKAEHHSPDKQEHAHKEEQTPGFETPGLETPVATPEGHEHKEPKVEKIEEPLAKESPHKEQTEEHKTETQAHEESVDEDALNLMFYQGKIKARPNGENIDTLLSWQGDHDKITENGWIGPWLYPTLEGGVNGSQALTQAEADAFISNAQIAEKLVKSYEFGLAYVGLKLSDKKTGAVEKADGWEARYQAIINQSEMQQWIKRILIHLNNVGFRRYAIELVNFWETEIYGEVEGYGKFQTSSKKNRSQMLPNLDTAPLKDVAGSSEIFRVWRWFGSHNDEKKRITDFEKNAFVKISELKDSVYLTS